MSERKEGTILFNDALSTFYLRLYGVGHIVKEKEINARLFRHMQQQQQQINKYINYLIIQMIIIIIIIIIIIQF